MKILCICERGNSRSPTLGWILKDRMGHDVIAMGIRANSNETKQMLYKWAERIILVDKDFLPEIPQEFHEKVKVWDVGKDIYFIPHPDLIQKYNDFITKEGI